MKLKFTLLCIMLALTIAGERSMAQALLLKQGFDTLSSGSFILPTGWKANIVTSAGYWGSIYSDWYDNSSNSYMPYASPHSGNGMVMIDAYEMNSSPPTGDIELTSPKITLPSTGTNIVSFWIYLYGSYYDDSLSVYVSSTTSASGGTEIGSKVMIDSAGLYGWYQFFDTIPSSITGDNYIIFEANPNYAYMEYDIDDVLVGNYLSCSGTPYAGYIGGPNPVCSGTQFTLTDTSLTFYTGMTYQWQSKPTGTTTWNNIFGATGNSYKSYGIYSATDYRVVATCSASGQTDTSYAMTENLNAFYNCYCNTYLYYTSYSPPPTIDSVAISSTTLHNATHTTLPAPNYYAIYPDTGSATAVLRRGSYYTLYAKYKGATGYGMAWIDYNQNGSFDGFATPSEFMNLNTCCTAASSGSYEFQVPLTADTGLTGMRIRISSSYYSYSYEACSEFFSGGETEDYLINIQPALGHDLTVSSILNPAAGSTTCANTNINVTAIVYNQGANADSNFDVVAVYSGPSSDTTYILHRSSLAPFTSDTVLLGTIAPPLGGTYTLKVYTVLSEDSNKQNDTSIISFKINPIPPLPVVTSDTVCTGGSATLLVSNVTGVNYNWYSADTGGTSLYSGTSLTINPLTSDTLFYVGGQYATTGCANNTRVPLAGAIGNAPLVNLGPDATVCASPSLTLNAGNPGGKYLWSTGDTTQIIHVVASGTYSVTVFKYCYGSDTINLTVNPLPFANGIEYDRTGNTYYFYVADPKDVTSYLWLFGDGDTSSLSSPVHSYATSGSYKVALVLTNSCGNDTIKLAVPLAVNTLEGTDNTLKLYPNPANSTITVSADNDVEFKDLMIMNSVGQVVYRGSSDAYKTQTINISQLPAGHYIFRANTSKGSFIKLFEVVR